MEIPTQAAAHDDCEKHSVTFRDIGQSSLIHDYMAEKYSLDDEAVELGKPEMGKPEMTTENIHGHIQYLTNFISYYFQFFCVPFSSWISAGTRRSIYLSLVIQRVCSWLHLFEIMERASQRLSILQMHLEPSVVRWWQGQSAPEHVAHVSEVNWYHALLGSSARVRFNLKT